MDEPSLRSSRLAIAGALVATALVGGTGFYLGRTTSPEVTRETREEPVSTAAPLPAVSTIVADSFLDRGDVIALAAAAADAASSGVEPSDRTLDAVGRRVEIALPFGCNGPAAADSEAPLRWRYDEQEETLRLHVAVTRWQASHWGLGQPADEAAADETAVEGFWVARPWSTSGECPVRPAGELAATATAPATATVTRSDNERSLAVAQFFRGDGRREALRDGRPFQSVRRIPRTEFAAPRGFRLMLSGRIGRVPGPQGGLEGPVRCVQQAGIESRPRCVVAVNLDEVRIENPADDTVLASWPIGRD